MKIKVTRTSDGSIIGISPVLPPHLTYGARGEGTVRAEIRPGPNQHIEELEVPDELAVHAGESFHKHLKAYLEKKTP